MTKPPKTAPDLTQGEKRELLVNLLQKQLVSDLNSEVTLDPDICSPGSYDGTIQPSSILLTGATGFMGAFLLYELLHATQAKIYCLVRASNTEEALQKLQRQLESCLLWKRELAHRILPIPGDLSQPLLGFSSQKFHELAAIIDSIYHCGATVNFVYPYQILRQTNVNGTKEILRLASKIRAKPVHFMSSLGVFDSVSYSKKSVSEDDPLKYCESPFTGYAQSKWVSDNLIALARSRGIPTSIYRLGFLTGPRQTGICNTKDLIIRTLKAWVQLGCAPNLDVRFDIAPVDIVARAIVHLSSQHKSIGKVFHMVHPDPPRQDQFIQFLQSLGYKIKVIPYEEWEKVLVQAASQDTNNALHTALACITKRIVHNGRRLTLFEMYTNDFRPTFKCRNTLEGLKDTSITWPPADAKLFDAYISYLIRVGFLDPPEHNARDASSH